MRLEPFRMFFDSEGREILYVSKLTTGDIIKYQNDNERAIKTIPMRSVTVSIKTLFFVLAKFAHRFLRF
jgi:hypothetical protein